MPRPLRTAPLAAALAALALAPASGWAQASAGSPGPYPGPYGIDCAWHGHMGAGYGWMMGGWWHGLIGLVGLLLVVGVLIAALRTMRHGRCPRCGTHGWPPGPWGTDGADPNRRALQILNERYARGEIDKAEFEDRRATLLSALPG